MALQRVREIVRGPSLHSAKLVEARKLNLSFVLHEPSTSQAVLSMAKASTAGGASDAGQAARRDALDALEMMILSKPDVVLTAHLGCPALLSELIAGLPDPPALVAIDAAYGAKAVHQFFRAPARLALPAWPVARIITAAVVVRPGGNCVELKRSQVRVWPDEAAPVLADLERLILEHVDQWRPPRALWDAPAEVLLPEVSQELGSVASDAG